MSYRADHTWTDAEVEALRVHFPRHGPSWDGWDGILDHRSYAAIKSMARRLCLEMEGRPRASIEGRLREADARVYDIRPTPDPNEGLVLELLGRGHAPSAIDRRMHWTPGRTRQILTARWAREKER